MYLSLNWLKQYVELPKNVTPAEFALKFTMSTVEVEGVENEGEFFSNIVVGKISRIEKHPDADRLRVTFVDVGGREAQIVCGGTNLLENMLVAVALPGSKVRWHGEGELVELSKTKVRGVESEGMICASEEIGLGVQFPSKAVGEILDLSEFSAKPGDSVSDALDKNDVIIEIDNKSVTNRPDLWGHYGMAREIAAIYGLPLKKYELKKIKPANEEDLAVKVQDTLACSRYLGILVKGIKIGPSPEWLRKRLESIGQKSINNIVDATNYILFDLGQPLHAFDARKIKEREIIVRRAVDGEELVTLDGTERILAETDLVIADSEKAIALAGVMGGANSEITDSTDMIMLESANFDPFVVRKTANRFGLRSEAAIRFEKSLDPNLTMTALNRCVDLLLEMCPGAKVASPLVDVSNFKQFLGPIELTWEFIDNRIGQKIEHSQITEILTKLGFKVKSAKKGLTVTIPTWRATKDISMKEDLIEEITRIYGYDNLEPQMPASKLEYPEQNTLREMERQCKNILALAIGANESTNYSFIDKNLISALEITQPHVELLNPWIENLAKLRRDLIPNLLKNVLDNEREFPAINFFEIAKTFVPEHDGDAANKTSQKKLPKQDLMCAGVQTGAKDSFLSAKGIVESLLNGLNLEFSFVPMSDAPTYCHPKQVLQIMVQKESVGFVAVLHPTPAERLGIRSTVGLWQINLNKVLEFYPQLKKYQSLPKFPAIELDLAIVVDESINWGDVSNLVHAVEPKLIREINLFDVYKGDKIKAGKKSLAFKIIYRSDERTLELDEVKKLQADILGHLEKAVGAEVRM